MNSQADLSSRRWLLRDAEHLRWRWWDDECVVFQPASGATHHLHLLAADALESVRHAPRDSRAVAAQLAVMYELPHDASFQNRIDELLQQFAELGLVEEVRD